MEGENNRWKEPAYLRGRDDSLQFGYAVFTEDDVFASSYECLRRNEKAAGKGKKTEAASSIIW